MRAKIIMVKTFFIRIWELPRLIPCANADAMSSSYKIQF